MSAGTKFSSLCNTNLKVARASSYFCNLKRPEDLLNKYKNLCETNDPYHFNEKIDDKYLNLEEIKKKIDLKTDIIGRDDNFKKIEIDESFPQYIIDNISRYKEWISD